MHLNKSCIHSFCGDVVSLRMLSEDDISQKDICWSVEGKSVLLRTFSGEEEGCFNDGVLLILAAEGESVICAQCGEEKYFCKVSVRKRRTVGEIDLEKETVYNPEVPEQLKFFRGDLHIHATEIHLPKEEFLTRTVEQPEDVVRQISDEKLLDVSVITDHGSLLDNKHFYQGFVADEVIAHDDLVVFPGCESGLIPVVRDRYQTPYKEFGEIVTLNAAAYACTDNFEEFCELFAASTEPIAILAHPQVVGYDECGMWVSALSKHACPEFKSMVRMVEIGDGSARESNLINEYIYSLALDCGYKVTTCCNSDSHGNYEPSPGTTFIMAPEKSKEMIVDALRNVRAYACESGQVELLLMVNGQMAPAVLPITDTYHFHVRMNILGEDNSARPVICEVISDYGEKVKTLSEIAGDVLDFEIVSESARYFYLRLMDEQGRKTWSPPIWTGRAFDAEKEMETLRPLDKIGFTAYDEVSGQNVDVLVDDDPASVFASEYSNASIVIDMQKEYTICGIGHIAPKIYRSQLKKLGLTGLYATAEPISSFVSAYRISVSCDKINWTLCRSGSARVFGCEEIFRFNEIAARYVKFEVLSTTGRESGWKEYAEAALQIAELSVFGR